MLLFNRAFLRFGLTAIFLFQLSPSSSARQQQIQATGSADERYSGEGKITGGQDAEPHEFPWMVHLEVFLSNGVGSCGATLISDRCVLTSSRCIKTSYGARVVLGAHNRTDRTEPTRIEINSTQYYYGTEVVNDFNGNGVPSLVILPVKLTFSEFVLPIRLPKNDGTETDHVGDPITLAGWGLIAANYSTPRTEILQKLNTKVISNSECRATYLAEVNSASICSSGGGGVGPCGGDAGTPMMYFDESDGEWTQIGVHLHSYDYENGCESGRPSLYYHLQSPAILDWIDGYCFSKPPPFVCPDDFGAFPDVEDCHAFYTCFDGQPTHLYCSDDFAFNPETLMCDEIANVPDCN